MTGILPHKQILSLHAAVVSAHLTSSRAILLGGIARTIRDRLPPAPNPSDQILSDLDELNECGRLSDGSVPLRTWLENTLALVGPRPEADVFRSALVAVDDTEARRRRQPLRSWLALLARRALPPRWQELTGAPRSPRR